MLEDLFIEVGSVCWKHERAMAFDLQKRGDSLRELLTNSVTSDSPLHKI